MLVDLPGYGYAEASKTAVKRWTGLVRRYLQTRAALRRVCLLIDARHGIKEVDRPLIDMLDRAGVSYQIVLTKTDKLGPTALDADRQTGCGRDRLPHRSASRDPSDQRRRASRHRRLARDARQPCDCPNGRCYRGSAPTKTLESARDEPGC